jgi:uncharacterized MAPEG superfamily protein
MLIAGVLPLVCAGIAKAGFKNYDSRDLRAWLSRQTGFRARANAAQANSFEAFPFAAVGVILAILADVDPVKTDLLSIGFVLARVAYIACYVEDKATWRSIVWTAGYGCVIALNVLAIQAA